MAQGSGLDYQTIDALFFRYARTTPMSWIWRRCDAEEAAVKQALLWARPS